jgi:WD repeat-containing protein 61
MVLSRVGVQKDAHDEGVWSIAWAVPPAGGQELLLTGSVDETVKAWRVDVEGATGLAAVEEYTGHVLGVVSVAASATGLAATSSLDSVIRVWDLATGQAQAIFETPPAETWGLCFPPGDAGARHLASAGGASAGVALWNLDTKERDATFALPPPVRLLLLRALAARCVRVRVRTRAALRSRCFAQP